MTDRVRLAVFLALGTGTTLLLLWGVSGLPPFGHYRGPYGDILNHAAVPERHVTNVVAAVNFDYRGIDTIGEEYILFVSVAAVVALLRTERDELEVEPPEDAEHHPGRQPSEALHAYGIALVAPVVVLGLYIVSHGQLTPGGGFQGGAILASAMVLLFLAGEYRTLREVGSEERSEVADALGAAGFVAIGLAGLIAGAAFLQNIVPLGPVGVLYSAGMIPLINLSVGLEVGGGLLLVVTTLIRQVLQVRVTWRAREQQREHHQQEQ